MKVVELQSLRNSEQSRMLWEAAAKVFQLPKWVTVKKVYNGLLPVSALYDRQEFGEYEPDIYLKYNTKGQLDTLAINTATSGRDVVYRIDPYGINTVKIYFGKDGSTIASGSILFNLREDTIKMFPDKDQASNYLNRFGLDIVNGEQHVIKFSDYTGPINSSDYGLYQQCSEMAI